MNKKNVSSGAEKAEKLATDPTADKTANTTKPTPKHKSTTTKNRGAQQKIEPKTAKTTTRIDRAERRALLEKERAEQRQALYEKRLEHKQKIAERRAKLKAERERLRHERRVKRAERIERERQAERRAKQDRRQRTPGFGGWLAATIALGVTTLALGTTTAYGWMQAVNVRGSVAAMQNESLYELNALVDNLDGNLAKVRVATSDGDRTKLLTKIAVESEMAETVLERMPLEGNRVNGMLTFFNKMGKEAQDVLYKTACGKQLTESDIASIEYMYKTNAEVKKSLNDVCLTCTDKDLLRAFDGKDGMLFDGFGKMESYVTTETPKEIFDGPFAESKQHANPKAMDGLKEITASRAEELAQEYFNAYPVSQATCTGEAVSEKMTVFNVVLKTEDGEMLAQLSKKGGRLVMFDSFKDCENKNFDVERCTVIADEFLKDLGLENMVPVWASENGTTCNLNFVYMQNGVLVYPDMIKLKVCEERGIVTGMEAVSYCLNHDKRIIPDTRVTPEVAKKSVSFDSKGGKLCLIPHDETEVLAYEFLGEKDGITYYSYIDAKTGEEIELFTVVNTKQGKSLY